MKAETLPLLFEPRSLAVVGASSREGSIGRALVSNALLNGYTGIVYPVNRKAKSVLGVRAYASVIDIPDDVDLAVLVVPAVAVPEALAECGQKGVRSVVVISAGFKELGPQGEALEGSLKEKARRWGISLVGPNCLGVINTSPRFRLNATFGRLMPKHGNVAFVTQSGAVGVAALEYAETKRIGLSKFASIGNKADVNENDLLAYLKEDDETDVILLYLEDLADPPTFMRIARDIVSDPVHPKPILAIKSGRTSEGARAASSHTGALAGSDEVFNAFFTQSRILRVESLHDLFDHALSLANQPPPKKGKVAILTNAGGIGIMATDTCVRNGLELARFAPETEDALRGILPPTASVTNPVDVIGDADEERYGKALASLCRDDDVGGVIAVWTPTFMTSSPRIARTIAGISGDCGKPILACLQTVDGEEDVRRELEEARIPRYRFPEDAARAMAALALFGEKSRRPQGEVARFEDVRTGQVQSILNTARARNASALLEPEGHEILNAFGLPVLSNRMTTSEHEARDVASAMGFPVAIKVVSPDILHKTDVGGVRVGIRNENALATAWRDMMEDVRARVPEADVRGILVQKMAPSGGTEVILGMKRDPQFGPLLMFGLGGVLVEALKDVTFRVAPINNFSAEAMIREVKAYRILRGFRGMPARDTDAIRACLQRLSQLVTTFEAFDEIDVNPLLVYEEGRGAVVVDGRFLLRHPRKTRNAAPSAARPVASCRPSAT